MRLDEWVDRETMDVRLFLSYWIDGNRSDPTKFPLSMEEHRWREELEKWKQSQKPRFDEE